MTISFWFYEKEENLLILWRFPSDFIPQNFVHWLHKRFCSLCAFLECLRAPNELKSYDLKPTPKHLQLLRANQQFSWDQRARKYSMKQTFSNLVWVVLSNWIFWHSLIWRNFFRLHVHLIDWLIDLKSFISVPDMSSIH